MKNIGIAAALIAWALTAQAPLYADDLTAARLNTIEANQEKILQKLDEIKTELEIVKVRVTLKA